MAKKEEIDLAELEAELNKAIEEADAGGVDMKEEDMEEEDMEEVKDKKVEGFKAKRKAELAENAESAAEAVEEGFGNINQMIYERLDINRACLMILLVLVLILIFKEDIMKTSFVKNLLK